MQCLDQNPQIRCFNLNFLVTISVLHLHEPEKPGDLGRMTVCSVIYDWQPYPQGTPFSYYISLSAAGECWHAVVHMSVSMYNFLMTLKQNCLLCIAESMYVQHTWMKRLVEIHTMTADVGSQLPIPKGGLSN